VLNSPYLAKTNAPSNPAIFLLGSQMVEDGVQSALIHQARWFYKRGYRVVTAFLGDPEGVHGSWQARLPVPLINFQAFQAGSNPVAALFHLIKAALRAMRLFAVGEFNILETFGAEANLLGLPLGRLAGVPVRTANLPSRPVRSWWKSLHSRAVSRCATQIVAVSDHAKRLGIAGGIPAERMAVVRRGVAEAEEMDWQRRRRLRSELDVPEDGCLIASAGGMQSAQVFEDLLFAIPRLLERFPLCRFALIGEGPARAELVQKSRQLGIAAFLRFPGRRPDLLRLIAAADIYFQPPADEGLPPYLLDAMTARRPIVAVESEQVLEFIQPDQTALLAQPGDPQSLADMLGALISDTETRSRIGSAAFAFVQENHSLERMCADYAVLLDPSYHVEAA